MDRVRAPCLTSRLSLLFCFHHLSPFYDLSLHDVPNVGVIGGTICWNAIVLTPVGSKHRCKRLRPLLLVVEP